jgi:UDP-3-O-[3-hydroxymyristoyl] N-acetylglucosamine deacetylase/3-hydroxyacyl-[acyl-carrier-protein] dehydratase
LRQQTLARAIELKGKGLHSAAEVSMVLRPGEAGKGLVFRRSDIDGAPEIPARVEQVTEMDRGTVLEQDGVRVRTIEHLLSAIAALEIDNVIIELDAEEPPAMDGSAEPFTSHMSEAGVASQEADAAVWTCKTPFVVKDSSSRYAVLPDERYLVSASIEFDHPLIRRQHASYEIKPELFSEQIGPARTFGFLEDAEKLWAIGLAQGADTDNTVVLTQDGLYEGVELRYDDEPVRHKILDIVGDLALVGHRIQAQIVAERPGHRGNIALARAIAEQIRREKAARRVDVDQIIKMLPHRFPFLLVDRVIAYEKGKRIIGIKNVTINEEFFVGHFPGMPIMPGVLIIEAMAQVGGLLLMDSVENPESKVVYFMSLDNVKFRRPVVPGDQLEFELEMVQMRKTVCRMKGVGRVDGRVVAEAELKAQVVDR